MKKLETLSFDSFLETWSERASPQGFSLGSLHHRNDFLSLCPNPRKRVGHTRPLPGLCQCRRGHFILHCSRGVSVFMVDGSLSHISGVHSGCVSNDLKMCALPPTTSLYHVHSLKQIHSLGRFKVN